MVDIPGEDLNALKALRNKVSTIKGSSSAARREADRKSMLKPNDGRRARSTGPARDQQINLKTTREVKDKLFALSREFDLSMAMIFERGVELFEAEARQKKGGSR